MTILVQTYDGCPDGMNLASSPWEIKDTEARYLQDILLDIPGQVRSRGAVTKVNNSVSTTYRGAGIAATIDPAGTYRIGVVNGDNAHGVFSMYNSMAMSSKVDYTLPYNITTQPTTNPYPVFDSKPTLRGGSWIGISRGWDASSSDQVLALWKGGNLANYTTGTVGLTRGSTAVTGSGTTWTTNVVPGMFLFANTNDPYTGAYIGVVAKVTGNTTLTLVDPSPYAATAKSYTIQSLRGFCPQERRGLVTCDTSISTVTGGATKFTSMAAGWQLYRASDWAFIGKINAINNDTSITLAANAAISCNNERYVAINPTGDYSLQLSNSPTKRVGFLNAVYAGRQWYANLGSSTDNTTRVWFSDPADPEAVDLNQASGDFIPVESSTGPHTPVKAIAGSVNALIVLKDTEAFAIYGNTPSTFSVKKIEDDGTVHTGSVQSYAGGVLWAGKQGIQFYDGQQVNNLTEGNLGRWYVDMMAAMNPTKYSMGSMVSQDHYFLFIESAVSTYTGYKGAIASIPPATSLTICLNLATNAVTTLSNVNIRGSAAAMALSPSGTPPQSSSAAYPGYQVYYLVNDANNGWICSSIDLFKNQSADTIDCDADLVTGPDFYMESKRYSLTDPLRQKMFKQIGFDYFANGDDLKLDTIIGLGETGSTTSTRLTNTANTVFTRKRIKFLKRDTHFGFRAYENSSSVLAAAIGAFQLGFKFMRPGRV